MPENKQTLPTLPEKFLEMVARQPERIFLSEPVQGKTHSITWKQAGEDVLRMTAWLQSLSLPAGSRIAILGKNSSHWILADLAIMLAGHVSVPLYPTISAHLLKTLLEHSDSRVIFAGKLDHYGEMEPGIPDGVLKVCFPHYPHAGCLHWYELTRQVQPVKEPRLPDPLSLQCILYTSGTTGPPKGVMHHYYAHSFSLLTVMEALGNDFRQEIFFSYLPLCHVAERMVVEHAGVFSGGTVYFPESIDTFSRDLQAAQPTVFLAVPRIWEKFREEIEKKIPPRLLSALLAAPLFGSVLKKLLRKKLGLSRARHVLCGASPIHPALQEWFARLGIIIQEAYGMTENMALSTINRKKAARFGTVGQGYPGVEIRLAGDGEIQVKSEATMLGYFHEPALTAECFDGEFLKTGDQGRFDADGYLLITGRIKDQFKTSKGKYVSPAPIEKLLLEHPALAMACVTGSGLAHPIVLCQLKPGIAAPDDTALAGLLERVNQQLEYHERLARLVVLTEEWTVANGLLTPTLKIRRAEVDARYGTLYHQWLEESGPVVRV